MIHSIAMFEPQTVLEEINGISRYRKPFEQFGIYHSVPEELTHSNIPFDQWLDSTIGTGMTAVQLFRQMSNVIPAVSQPGMAMAFGLMGVPGFPPS